MDDNKAYAWACRLCECAGEDADYVQKFWSKITQSEGVFREFEYYLTNAHFLGEYTVSGMSIIDIMIWQMDHFKSDLDRGLYDMQSNPDKMLLKAFETMLSMEENPEPYMRKYQQDTGTDYPGKI